MLDLHEKPAHAGKGIRLPVWRVAENKFTSLQIPQGKVIYGGRELYAEDGNPCQSKGVVTFTDLLLPVCMGDIYSHVGSFQVYLMLTMHTSM